MKKFKIGDNVSIFNYALCERFNGKIKKINDNKITVNKKTFDTNDSNIDIQVIKEYKDLKPKKMFILYEYDERYRGQFNTLKEVDSYLREMFDMNCREDFKKFCADYKIVEEYRYV